MLLLSMMTVLVLFLCFFLLFALNLNHFVTSILLFRRIFFLLCCTGRLVSFSCLGSLCNGLILLRISTRIVLFILTETFLDLKICESIGLNEGFGPQRETLVDGGAEGFTLTYPGHRLCCLLQDFFRFCLDLDSLHLIRLIFVIGNGAQQ